jgi:drug/metabolite transporter (DMT)-like permease
MLPEHWADRQVYEIVLAAAVLHGIWNFLLKDEKTDSLAKVTLFNLVPALIAAPLIFRFGLPSQEIHLYVTYLIPAAILQIAYTVGLVWALRICDLAQVHPIVRGTTIVLTTIAAALFFADPLDLARWIAVLAIALGVFVLSTRGGSGPRYESTAICLAILAGAANSAFTLLDGYGARASSSPHAYAAVLFVLVGVGTLLAALLWRGPDLIREMKAGWRKVALGGALSLIVYWIAIWAMTIIPIPLVAALRGTSVLYAAALAFLVLRERPSPARAFAAAGIMAGIVIIIYAH